MVALARNVDRVDEADDRDAVDAPELERNDAQILVRACRNIIQCANHLMVALEATTESANDPNRLCRVDLSMRPCVCG